MKSSKFNDFLLITIGTILVAVAVVYFFQPNEIAAGGVTGLAIVINNYIPSIPTGPLVLIMNLILFTVAFIVVGGKFGGKTIYASIALSVAMWVLEEFLPFSITGDLMLVSVFGALISSVGMAIVFNANASTGGTDILAKILSKFIHFDIGKALLVVDFVVTFLGAITFGINMGLYGLLAVIISGISIDKIISGFNVRNEISIISQQNEEIKKYILEDLERGCSYLKAIGGFTGEDIKVLHTVLNRAEFIKLKRFISDIDKKAFITVGEVHEVMGEGFKHIDEEY